MAAMTNAGSPPRVRGKHKGFYFFDRFFRITPARAGKTCRISFRARSMADHPRACGENMAMLYEQMKEQGSPPRVRGKHA